MDKPRKIIGNMVIDPSPNTIGKRNKEESRRKSGLKQFKLYFGFDVERKLAELYLHQYGHHYVQEGKRYKDTEGIADVLSCCINYYYEHVLSKQHDTAEIAVLAANSPLSHEIYRLHQIVAFRHASLRGTEGSRSMLRSVASFMTNNDYTPLKAVLNPNRYINKTVAKWDIDDIENLLDIATVCELIEKNNKRELK